MPVNMSKYPSNWSEIRKKILLRAGGRKKDPRVGAKCEFCGVQNYSVRLSSGVILEQCSSYKNARKVADHHNKYPSQLGDAAVIVLTIAHLEDPNPQNCNDDNLAALCQRCHNKYDMKMRVQNRKTSSIQLQIKNGQLSFSFFEQPNPASS